MSFIIHGEHGKRPEGAKQISKGNLLEFYNRVIYGWDTPSDIWALSQGASILGAASAISGIYINTVFRRKLRLGNYGHFSTYLPIAVIPTVTTALYQKTVSELGADCEWIRFRVGSLSIFLFQATINEIILNPLKCPLCVQTTATVLQLGAGVVQPFILASASTLMFATRHFTYRFPSIISHPKKFLKFYTHLTRPMAYPMMVNFALQAIAVQFVTYKAREHFFYLQQEMTKNIPRDIDELEERTEWNSALRRTKCSENLYGDANFSAKFHSAF